MEIVIGVDELRSMLAKQTLPLVVDVRKEHEWAQGHITGALHIPLGQLTQRSAELPVDQTIILVCKSGKRSAKAWRLLSDMGYTKLYSLQGGMNEWYRLEQAPHRRVYLNRGWAMRKSTILATAALVLVAGFSLGYAFLSRSTAPAGQHPPDIAGPTLTIKAMAFDKTELEAEHGKPVRITITNEDKSLHDFSIDKIDTTELQTYGGPSHKMFGKHPDLHLAVGGGESASVVFTPAEPGTYVFYCSVSGHAAAGMKGTLVVR